LYVRDVIEVPAAARVTAWRPQVPGIAEVFHAHFVDHAYPLHTHAEWSLLIVDDGTISYDLDRHNHGALGTTVSLLPPHVPHDGRTVTSAGFRKRVLYLDAATVGTDLIGAAVDQPTLRDPLLRHRIHQLHTLLTGPDDTLEAESRLALIRARIRWHLRKTPDPEPLDHPAAVRRHGLADDLRDLLDTHVVAGLSLTDAGAVLHADPSHLVRTFTRAFGLPPHRYLTGRRVDLARRLLLAGVPAGRVATDAGFHDQPHLTRTFTRYLGTPPARYATARQPPVHTSPPKVDC
jgi:AraC-like DNA-binding protein